MKLTVRGDARVPGDKSLTHRALMLAAAASGRSRLSGLLDGEDCQSTARILRALGAHVPSPPAGGGEIVVDSEGLEFWTRPPGILDCGNSGTTARLMMGLLAGRPFTTALTGDESLRSRPMRRVTAPLVEMGAAVRELGAPDRLPLEITGGSLHEIFHISPHASAQIKSAVLLAGISGRVPVSVLEPARSRDHTERMLELLGAAVESRAHEGGWLVRLEPPAAALDTLEMRVPGDPSSAAFLLALALLADKGEVRVRDVCVNPTRTGFLEVLRRMGGDVRMENERMEGGEPVADLLACPSELRGATITASEVPSLIDEIPILAALATRATGTTTFTGAGELRAKESDRISVLVSNLRRLGAQAEELTDGLVVEGSHAPLRGTVSTHHDHRIAMAFGVLGSLAGNAIEVDLPRVVDVSFPGFWPLLASLTSGGSSAPPIADGIS
jgi:3-phosphoshikimate 1-carboxyvinyltransferase